MKKLAFLFLLTFATLGFSQKAQTYEYLTMVQNVDLIYLTKDNSFEKIDITGEVKKTSVYNYSPLLKRIQEYEEQGWELFSSTHTTTASSTPQNYVMMRRKK